MYIHLLDYFPALVLGTSSGNHLLAHSGFQGNLCQFGRGHSIIGAMLQPSRGLEVAVSVSVTVSECFIKVICGNDAYCLKHLELFDGIDPALVDGMDSRSEMPFVVVVFACVSCSAGITW